MRPRLSTTTIPYCSEESGSIVATPLSVEDALLRSSLDATRLVLRLLTFPNDLRGHGCR